MELESKSQTTVGQMAAAFIEPLDHRGGSNQLPAPGAAGGGRLEHGPRRGRHEQGRERQGVGDVGLPGERVQQLGLRELVAGGRGGGDTAARDGTRDHGLHEVPALYRPEHPDPVRGELDTGGDCNEL